MRLIALLLLLTACSEPLGPAGEAVPHDAFFYAMWADVERCSGLRGDPDAVRRILPAGSTVTRSDGVQVSGYWSKAGNVIVIARDWADQPNLLRHEQLHALLARDGHPVEYFRGDCLSLVTYGPAD